MEKSEVVISLEIAQEIRRLEELYNHYKKLYHKVRFLCCSEQRETVDHLLKRRHTKTVKIITVLRAVP